LEKKEEENSQTCLLNIKWSFQFLVCYSKQLMVKWVLHKLLYKRIKNSFMNKIYILLYIHTLYTII